MSKAEERALKVYPIKIAERDGYDENLRERKGFVKGYHQAEKDLTDKAKTSSSWDGFFYGQGYNQAKKDLELTLEDIRIILDIENDILHECNSQKELVIKIYPKGEDYYGEILKRFKERKETKN